MAHDKHPIAEEVCEEFKKLHAERTNWESLWQEVAERIVPAHSSTFNRNWEQNSVGQKKTENLFDSTASIALNRFTAILDSLLTPRSQIWHKLIASDPNLNKERRVKLWFEEATRILFKHRYAPMANFPGQNQLNYQSIGAYGTGTLFIDKLANQQGLRYRHIHISEIFFKENHQGLIDCAYRRFRLKPRQAIQWWGEENLPEKLTKEKDQNKDFYFIHRVKPNPDYNPERLDSESLQFRSDYVMEDPRHDIDRSGYSSFPYPISRYNQAPGELYGRGPAIEVLPAIKTLNEEKKTLLKQGHRAVDPVILAHDDGVLDSFSLKPGHINYGGVNKDGRPLVSTLPIGNPLIGKEMMDDERAVINDAFLTSIFQILVQTPTMSATEVLERTKEKGILLAPTVGRIQTEYLGPLIEREVDLLLSQGALPPLPPELVEAEGEFEIEYDSPLSQTQRASEAAGFFRTVEQALQFAQATGDPSPLDHFNFDEAVPAIAQIQGSPAKWMKSMEQIQVMREERAAQQDLQTAIQAGPSVAALAKAAPKEQTQ